MPTHQMSAFDIAMNHVLQWEGGYVDHPRDPGGATNMGITIGTLSAWLGRRASKAEVKALSKETAMLIYRERYWRTCHCDSLPIGLAILVMDAAVNSGPGNAGRALQRAVNEVNRTRRVNTRPLKVDGAIGPNTLGTVNLAVGAGYEPELMAAFVARRMWFYGPLKTFRTFGLGWSRRLAAGALVAARAVYERESKGD